MATLTVCTTTKVSVGLRKDAKVPNNIKDLHGYQVWRETLLRMWKYHLRRGVAITPREFEYLYARTVIEVLPNRNGRVAGRWKPILNWAEKVLTEHADLQAKFALYEGYLVGDKGRERIARIREISTTKNRIKAGYAMLAEYMYANLKTADFAKITEIEQKTLGWWDELSSKMSFWNLFMAGVALEEAVQQTFASRTWFKLAKEYSGDFRIFEDAYGVVDTYSVNDGIGRAIRELKDEDFIDIWRSLTTAITAEVYSGAVGLAFKKFTIKALHYLAQGALTVAQFHPTMRALGTAGRLLTSLKEWFRTSILADLGVWMWIEWEIDGEIQMAMNNYWRTVGASDPEILGLTKAEWKELFDLTGKIVWGEGGISIKDTRRYNELLAQLDAKGKAIHSIILAGTELKKASTAIKALWDDDYVRRQLGLNKKDIEKKKKYIDIAIKALVSGEGLTSEQEIEKRLKAMKDLKERLEEVKEEIEEVWRSQWNRAREEEDLPPMLKDPQYLEREWGEQTYSWPAWGAWIWWGDSDNVNFKKLDWSKFKGLKVYADDWGASIETDTTASGWTGRMVIRDVVAGSGHRLCCWRDYRGHFERWYLAYFRKEGQLFKREDIIRLIAQGFQADNKQIIKSDPNDRWITIKFQKPKKRLKVKTKYKKDEVEAQIKESCMTILKQIDRVRKIVNANEPLVIEFHSIYGEWNEESGGNIGTGATCWIPDWCNYSYVWGTSSFFQKARGGLIEIKQTLEGNLIVLTLDFQYYEADEVGWGEKWIEDTTRILSPVVRRQIRKILATAYNIRLKDKTELEFVICTKDAKLQECEKGVRVHPPKITCAFNFEE